MELDPSPSKLLSHEEMSQADLFDISGDGPSFEDFAEENGSTTWWASDLSVMLGYASPKSFEKVVNRAVAACTRLDIGLFEHFQQVHRDDFGRDYKLSRFACFLVVMNADSSKEKVNQAQVYFAVIADQIGKHLESVEGVDRLLKRGEISEHEKSLSSTARAAGVQGSNFGRFKNSGYMGLYNMSIGALRARKGVPHNRTPLDFMGSTELAANLFRITQTEEKIRNEQIRGQINLENTARGVGATVRRTMQEISGTTPEQLSPREDIKKVKTKLRGTKRDFDKIEAGKKLLPGRD